MKLQTPGLCGMTLDPRLSLSPTVVLRAPVLQQNLSDHNVNVSSSVTLHCPAQGVPQPRVVWYKDQSKLQQVSGRWKVHKFETKRWIDWIFNNGWILTRFIIKQALCCFLRKELFILTELQLKTRDFTRVRQPMRGGLWRAPPTFGFKVSEYSGSFLFVLIYLSVIVWQV